MGEIVNLRQARKAKARADACKVAETNRAAFGRTKAERQLARTDAERTARKLDGAKIED